MFQLLFYLLVSFLASVAGAICGIGGGVIIKPVLDLCGLASVSTISFLSGLTVLSMSLYSVARNAASGGGQIDVKTGTPLAVGAAAGGIVGKQLFSLVKGLFENPNTVGAVQAACLAVITLFTLLYTIFKSRIKPHRVESLGSCLCIGLLLGIMSSFLGIGGGPINLVVLYFFFSMDTKTAAANSLYIILFSQLCSLLTTLLTNSVPDFRWTVLVLMAAGGLGGGILGRKLNRKMKGESVERLFIALMVVIICVSVFNAWRYAVQ